MAKKRLKKSRKSITKTIQGKSRKKALPKVAKNITKTIKGSSKNLRKSVNVKAVSS